MTNFLFILSLLMYFSGLLVFGSSRKHLLLMLLALEFIVVSLYMNIMIVLSGFNFEFYFSMVFLTMSVCEGALGLSVLVSLIRSHGSDYFSVFSVLW